ncbi:ribosomal protein S18-alanine N-acetyltransferase [Ectothiorhodospiraceae bacterium 2226]|nr:ribosomal protein S18-alanine N-acetyltransferase [Ectothiorhodospiraceae bacterium 2226]
MELRDLDAVMDIECSAYAYPWTVGIFRDCLQVGYDCWVYVREGWPVGYGIMSVAAGEAHILNLCVDPQHQRQGIGRRLLEHLLARARGSRAQVTFLEVRKSNRSAVELYRGLGFKEIGRRPAYYPAQRGREDALVLSKPL